MSDQNPAAITDLLTAVQHLTESYEENTDEMRAVRIEMDARFALYVPKSEAEARETRIKRALAGVLVVLIVMLGLGVEFRRQDQAREKDRRVALERESITQRQSLLQGCQRGNDTRVTLQQIITTAVADIPIPPDTPPDLMEQYAQRNATLDILRARLLALPGVQAVDCAAAYPPLPGEGK